MSDNWDDNGPSVAPQNSGFSNKENTGPFGGFGKGKGLGRGVLKQFTENSAGLGSGDSTSKPVGFGSAQVNGFGGEKSNNTDDDWNETPSSSRGFGSNDSDSSRGRGGFGGRGGSSRGGFGGGFGKSGSGGRSNDDSDNEPSSARGGFGGRGGFGKRSENGDDSGSSSRGGFGSGGRGGFGGGFGKRNENGDAGGSSSRGGFGSGGRGGFGGGFGKKNDDSAPRGGGFGRGGGSGDRGKGCFKCGEEGHMSRECPSQSSSSSRACFKCGEEGHMSRECPSQSSSSSRACFKCGEEGHMSRECPSQSSSSSRACFKCGEEGHMSRECPNQDSSSSSRGKGCFKCGEEGHMSRECPNQDSSSKGKGCFKCGEDGHMARDCTNEAKDEDGKPREAPYIPPPPPESEEDIFKSIQKGINFDKYDQIPVDVTGRDPPKCIHYFAQAGLYEAFHANVIKSNYEKPTPVQKYSIPIIMAGRDLMSCAQTGSGKTAAFLLPVLTGMMKNGLSGSKFSPIQEPQALVIAPTRELACQINEDARKFAYNTMLRPVVVYGGTSTQHQLRDISNGAHIVIGTPGRLSDFIQKGKISLEKLKYLILDEADRMLDMGFEPEVRKIVEQFGMPSKSERQTLMFSATFPEEIQKLAADFLNDYLFLSVGRVGGANTDVEQHVYEVERHEKRQKLCDILSDAGTDKTLVFVEQKRNADFLASYLSQSGFPTTSIHGDRLQREREEALRDFKTGRAPILVATSVAARGLDIPEVKHVVNYDLPQSIDEYVHRIGRTGRCGNLGRATSFYTQDSDGALAKSLIRVLADARQEIPDWLESYSVGGMSETSSSRFGGKDIRRGKFDNSKQSSDGFQSSAPASYAPAEDDESWD